MQDFQTAFPSSWPEHFSLTVLVPLSAFLQNFLKLPPSLELRAATRSPGEWASAQGENWDVEPDSTEGLKPQAGPCSAALRPVTRGKLCAVSLHSSIRRVIVMLPSLDCVENNGRRSWKVLFSPDLVAQLIGALSSSYTKRLKIRLPVKILILRMKVWSWLGCIPDATDKCFSLPLSPFLSLKNQWTYPRARI